MKRIYKMVDVKCAVCKETVTIDEYGYGDACPNCGWVQSKGALTFPNASATPILVSLSKARKLYAEGKPLKPDFNDYIEACEEYGEMEFYHNNIKYLVIGNCGSEVNFETCNLDENIIMTFKNLDEFAEKATINGRLLKDIWDDVENPFYLQ